MKDFCEQAYSLGYEYEKKFHGCAQCVVAAVEDTFAVSFGSAFKAMTGFGGGGGGICSNGCGAYAGGIAVLSCLTGRDRTRFEDIDVSRTYELTRKLHRRFIEKYGTIFCRDIMMKIFNRPFYTADPDDYLKFQEAGSYTDKCTDVVGLGAKWTAEIIIECNLLPEKRADKTG